MIWTEPRPLDGPDPSAEDAARIEAVLRGLDRLRGVDPAPLAQGLGPEMAAHCLALALDLIGAEGLAAGLPPEAERARTLTLVAAHGVFTSPIEWVALALASGAAVRLKAPSRDPALALALAAAMVAEGLPCEVRTDRDLGRPEALLVFGEDETVASVSAPGARVSRYGHRFSAALAGPDTDPAALALDIARYDSRGCMAPVAIFTEGDPVALTAALAPALADLERRLPRGEVDPALGPAWRRRLGLARASGGAQEGPGWAALDLAAKHFEPIALPRMATVHHVDGPARLAKLLGPWRPWLSSCACPADPGPDWERVLALFPRRCAPGSLQAPAFPRMHDGRPMSVGLRRLRARTP